MQDEQMQYEGTGEKAAFSNRFPQDTPVLGNFSEFTLVLWSYKGFSRHSYIKYLTTYQH